MKIPMIDRSSRRAAALSLAAWLIVSGCGTTKNVTKGNDGTPGPSGNTADSIARASAAESLLKALEKSYASTPMLSLSGDMKIAGAGVTVWYDALVRGRDSLKINLVGPFGIPVGALSATPSEFLFFNAQEGEAIEGVPDRETFGKLMMLDLEFDEMASMLRGELPRIPEPGTYTAEEDDGVMHYTVRKGHSIERFDVDIEDLAVESYTRSIMTSGEPIEEFAITYKDFNRLGGRQFPKKVFVNIANGEQKVTVSVDKMRSTIDKDRSCALVLPPGIERKRL